MEHGTDASRRRYEGLSQMRADESSGPVTSICRLRSASANDMPEGSRSKITTLELLPSFDEQEQLELF